MVSKKEHYQFWASPSSDCSRRKAARLLRDLPSTWLRFNSFFNVIEGTVMVIRWGELHVFSLPMSLLIPDEVFMALTLPVKHYL